MINIDPRAGSGDLLRYLANTGVPAQLAHLEFGDVAFLGTGPGDIPVSVGVEVKTVGDILNCIETGRFAGHQLPGLVTSYQDPWLLMEGGIRCEMSTGVLQLRGPKGQWFSALAGRRSFMYRALDLWLLTMTVKGGIRFRQTQDRLETAQFIRDLYSWWTQGWTSHRSHLAQNTGRAGGPGSGNGFQDTALLIRPSLLRRLAAELSGVGWEKSRHIEAHFVTIDRMLAATERDWREVEGVGKVMAAKIHKELHSA